MKLIFILILILGFSSCDRIDFELHKMSKEIRAEEAHLASVADGTRVIDDDPEPKWPGSDGEKTLEGIDADNDGLRDDVEIWINETIKDRNERMAIKQYARDQIKFMMGYNKSKEEVIKLHNQRMNSRECYNFFWFLSSDPLKEEDHWYSQIVNSKIFNTKERLERHTEVSDILGSYSYGANYDTYLRGKNCEFKIEDLSRYLEKIKINHPKLKKLTVEDLQ